MKAPLLTAGEPRLFLLENLPSDKPKPQTWYTHLTAHSTIYITTTTIIIIFTTIIIIIIIKNNNNSLLWNRALMETRCGGHEGHITDSSSAGDFEISGSSKGQGSGLLAAPLALHGPPQELLHVPRHVHGVVQASPHHYGRSPYRGPGAPAQTGRRARLTSLTLMMSGERARSGTAAAP
ncbi:hypothetical protein EYF80_037025 [Liparis tanakae]|uniref:Uncharacterized protein n=1 Tax=Liparis tanakae TaxID=230148 RepID=A0A4Z2GJ89_9TELE|nr:hypothetical protein EYF80_037025 [Liparis tanakae]